MEKIKRKRARIGDVIEIPIHNKLAYTQYSHRNRKYGELIRILPGQYNVRPNDFSSIVQEKERYFIFFPLNAALRSEIFFVVANEEVPKHAKQFPLMRAAGARDISGKVIDWWLWDGEKEWKLEKLSLDQRKLSIRTICNDTMLVERIKDGWLPEHSY